MQRVARAHRHAAVNLTAHHLRVHRAPHVVRGNGVEQLHLAGLFIHGQLDRLTAIDPRKIRVALAGVLVPTHARRFECAERKRKLLHRPHLPHGIGEGDLLAIRFAGNEITFEPHLICRAAQLRAKRFGDFPFQLARRERNRAAAHDRAARRDGRAAVGNV